LTKWVVVWIRLKIMVPLHLEENGFSLALRLDNMTNVHDMFDQPRKIKGLDIYPVRLKDLQFFSFAIPILQIEKNNIPDPMIISMSFLEFLYRASTEENAYILKLDVLLKICFKLPLEEKTIDYGFEEDKPFFKISDIMFYSSDFDELKTIICEQNLIELPDENISKEARDVLEQAKRYRERVNNSGRKMASLEDQMVAVSISTGLGLEYIYDLTIRKFTKMIERIDLKLHYEIYLAASLSGMVEFKDKSFIQHWLTEIDKDRYKDVLMEQKKMEEKIK
jgi:hypothetical protein